MTRILTLPQESRDKLVHEKARYLSGRPLHWLRWYVDQLDDAVLQLEPPVTRLVARELPLLLARSGWSIPYDPRWIAGRLSLRPEDVKRAIERLLTLERLVEIEASVTENGVIQPALFTSPTVERPPSDTRAVPEPPPSDTQADPRAATDVTAQINDSLASTASRVLAQTRQDKRREEPTSNATASSNGAASALPINTNDENLALGRLIAMACRGNPASIATVTRAAQGLPEYALVRALESLHGRRPPPKNPGGYVVETLRKIAEELGIERERVVIKRPEPEPPLA